MKGDKSSVLAQNKIRQEAFALQDTLSDIARWQQNIQQKDEQLTQKAKQAQRNRGKPHASTSHPSPSNTLQPRQVNAQDSPTPGNIFSANPSTSSTKPAAQPRAAAASRDSKAGVDSTAQARDEEERARGNARFKAGDFEGAVRFYTRAIGFNPRSAVAFSNRGMAYIKLKEYGKAEADCTDALALEENHVKSLSRRGTARNALGRHKAAFCDFSAVLRLEPRNRQAAVEIRKTREFIKASVRKQPRKKLQVAVTGAPTVAEVKVEVAKGLGSEKATGERVEEVLSCATDKEDVEESGPDAGTEGVVRKEDGLNKSCGDQSRAIKLPLKLPKHAPQTHYEFARVMKSLERDARLQHRYVDTIVGPVGLGKVFAKSGTLEPEELLQLMRLFKRFLIEENAGTTKALITALSRSPRLEMTLMFLKKDEKQEIADLFASLSHYGHDISTERQKFKIHE